MSLLSEIKAAVTGCGLPVETGVFSGAAGGICGGHAFGGYL